VPTYASWKDVPVGEQNVLNDLKAQYDQLTGYTVTVPAWALLNAASYGLQTIHELGGYMMQVQNYLAGGNPAVAAPTSMPWADLGINKDTYAALSTSYGTEYKKYTGQDIPAAALKQAFSNVKDPTGNNFLSASQYAQQLQQDTAIQNTYGWIKYGLDYQQFQQHKQAMTQAFGGASPDVGYADALGVQQLQYWHQNASATAEVRAQPASQAKNAPVTPGDSTSVVR
jgi:hypothetical protein